jgi:HD-GYP domain-containing protein (c-di-GMP phosphodiesterase class II)/putative methionine-R-sulfoxide reductase with GAF domain
VLGDEVVADINLDAFEDGVFNQDSIAIARQYALQVTALVASLRERAKLELRVREFEVIETLSAALRDLDSPQAITQRIVDETARLTNSPDAGLVLLEGETLNWSAAVGDFALLQDPIPKGRGLTWAALEARGPILSNEAHLDPRVFQHATPQPYSQITVPMLNSAGQPIGVLLSARLGANAYTAQDVRVLQVIANIANNALERVHNTHRLLEKLREFEVIEAVSHALGGAKTVGQAAQALTQETQRLLRSQNVVFYSPCEDGDCLQLEAHHGEITPPARIPRGRGLSWAAVEAKQTLLTPNVAADPRAFYTLPELPPIAQITLPIFDSEGGLLGVLATASWQEGSYSEADVRLMQLVASVAASALGRVRAGVALEVELADKAALLELSQMLEGNSKGHIQQALEYVRRLFGADAAVLSWQQEQKIRAHSIAGQLTPVLQARYDQGWSLEVARPINRYLSHSQLSVGTPSPFSSMVEELGIKATMAAELGKDFPLGGLVFYRFEQAQTWSSREVELAEGCARILGAVLNRVETARRLEDAYEGALRTIGIALEARDRETAGHTDRVARSAEQIGEAAGLTPTELRDLRWGAYLHDIGKLAIPDSILLKPGKLTVEEFSTMKTHSALGDDLVRNLPFVPPAARQVVRHHHERLDGRGYPDRLMGENIPLPARIFAICDVFDALCSERPYKSAMSPEDAARELWRSAQTGHLDPELVRHFLEAQGLQGAVLVSQAAD